MIDLNVVALGNSEQGKRNEYYGARYSAAPTTRSATMPWLSLRSRPRLW
jgi:hypothetical protein